MGDRKRSRANRAVASHTAVNLLPRDHFTAAIRLCQGAGLDENLAMATADHRAACTQLPVCGVGGKQKIYRADSVARGDRRRLA